MFILQASGCYGNGELKFICNSRTLPVSFIGGVADGLCWVLLQSTQCGQAYGKPKGSPYGTFKKSYELGMNKHWQALSNLLPVWAGDCIPQGLFTPIVSFVVLGSS